MALEIVSYTPEWEPGVRRFNERMVAGKATANFDIPDKAVPPPPPAPIRVEQFLAVDDTREVRGGIILQELPVWVDGSVQTGLNLQSTLSEGIIDKKYSVVAVQLIRFALKRSPLAYIVGIGGEEQPLSRLLKVAGWTVRLVPFYFRLLRPARCARELRPLRSTPARRIGASLASISGAAWLGAQLIQKGGVRVPAGYAGQPVEGYTASDDSAWSAFRPRCSFGVARDAATLPHYLRPDIERLRIVRQGADRGWVSMVLTQMSSHPYFGDLKVGTLVDVVASQTEDTYPAVALAVRHAQRNGCDILVTNQMHGEIRAAIAQAGFQNYRSNYVLATSKALSEKLRDETTLVTRQDGGGLTNLVRNG